MSPRPAETPEAIGVESRQNPPVIEPHLYLLMEMEAEAARWRRRSMFLLSILLHICLALILALSPELFQRGKRMLGIVSAPARSPDQSTFLYLPPDLQRPPKLAPRTPILSDKNRVARGPSPTVDPNGLKMPYLKGNTRLPEVAGGGHPAPPPSPPAAPTLKPPEAGTAKSELPGGSPTPPPSSKPEVSQLHLENVPPASRTGSGPNLSAGTPGDAIEQSLHAAARGRATGGIPGPGDSLSQFNNLNPNFNMQGPVILSDTKGVDFGPYLARVVYTVKQNWYSVIPETARLGQKGRVAIVFEILKDGKVGALRLVGSSGADPLDRAALASINASNPFPPLPEEFTGNHLILEFIYLYNMGYGP